MSPLLPDRHPAAETPEQIASECEVRRTRRSGPGGQNRNKVETAVVLRHRLTGITAEANERRSQAENLREAVFRLRVNLALAIRSPHTADAGPSPLWTSRLQGGRIVVNPEHDDFPTLLAEALDALAAHGDDPGAAAAVLGCTSSQLVKLLQREPRALRLVNDRRQAKGVHPLR